MFILMLYVSVSAHLIGLFTCKQAIMMVTSSCSYDSRHIFDLKQSKTSVRSCLYNNKCIKFAIKSHNYV